MMVQQIKTNKKIRPSKNRPSWIPESYRNVTISVYRPNPADLQLKFDKDGILAHHDITPTLFGSSKFNIIAVPIYDVRKYEQPNDLYDKIRRDIESTICVAHEDAEIRMHDAKQQKEYQCRVILLSNNEYIMGIMVHKDKQPNRSLHLI